MPKAKIIVVEDEFIVAKDLKSSLKKLGYSVPVTIAYGEEVLEKVREHKPDLVLMDIMLKGEMTGIDAAIQLMKEFDTPVVYLTAYADDNTLSKAMLSQPYGYLVKPYKISDLEAAIEKAFYKKEQNQSSIESHELDWDIISEIPESSILLQSPDSKKTEIEFSNILYLEGMKDQTLIITKDNEFIVNVTLNEIKTMLPEDSFVHVHIAFIVNIEKIFTIKYPELIVSECMKVLPIEPMYKEKIEQKTGILI